MWDYLTANESRGVIARPVFGDFTKGEQPRIGLYNDSHKPVRGKFTIKALDGERLVGEGTGDVEIPPYTERLVDVTVHSAYSFFQWHVQLDFIPAGYARRPIPKTELAAFHKTAAEFTRLSNRPDPELDFVDAVLWAGVERAWEANDLQMYARAVRDAGGRLYRFCGQQAEVREYVRKHLEAIEKPDTNPIPDLPTGDTKLVMDYDPNEADLVSSVIAINHKRLDPDAFEATRAKVSDAARARLKVAKQKTTVEMAGRLEDGYLVLDTDDFAIVVTGHVTLYDGQVNLGTYSLDGSVWHSERKLPFVAAERLVTFYQDKPSYSISLKLHSHAPAPKGRIGEPLDFWARLNRAIPGIRPLPEAFQQRR